MYLRLRELRAQGLKVTAARQKIRSEIDSVTGERYKVSNARASEIYNELNREKTIPGRIRRGRRPSRYQITDSEFVGGRKYNFYGKATIVHTDCENGDVIFSEIIEVSFSSDREPPPTWGEILDRFLDIAERVIEKGGTGSDASGCGYVEKIDVTGVYRGRTYETV